MSPALCCGALDSGKLQSVIGWEGMGEGWMGVRGEMGEGVSVCGGGWMMMMYLVVNIV